jgi:hypothetical protein
MTREDTGQSRRNFVRSVAVGGLAAGAFTAVSFAQDQAAEVAETFALVGVVDGWQGVQPQSIADQTNPTLELQAGETYRLMWQNGDGQPHNFAFLDSEGNEVEALQPLEVEAAQLSGVFNNTTNASAVNITANETMGNVTNATGNATAGIGATEIISEQGAVQVVEFEATEAMAEYYCEVHPNSMRGDVSLGGGGGGNATDS